MLAGHAIGGWTLVEPARAPHAMPFPGVGAMSTPLVWYDSVTVTYGGEATWRGFGAALATAVGHSLGPSGSDGGGRSVLDLRSGSFGFDENSLSIERGDSTAWFRGEAFGGNRGPILGLEAVGRHLWGASGSVLRGRHRFSGAYAERGASVALIEGDQQSASGESGAVGYRYRGDLLAASVTLARGRDVHESASLFEDVRPLSFRRAEETAAAAEVAWRTARDAIAARVEWRTARVTRTAGPEFAGEAAALWGATRYDRAAGDGTVRLEVGAGRHDLLGGIQVAPGVSYRLATRTFAGRVGIERVLHPVWADLGPDQAPFLQRTWAGVIEIGLGGPRASARAALLAGRTRDRALVARLPLEELWLRRGVTADPVAYDFGLVTVAARWAWRGFSAGGDGFALARDPNSAQPLVDPGVGVRTWGAWRYPLFGGDLGVTLRGEVEGIGAREAVCSFEGLPPELLPGYVTAGATAVFEIGSALITAQVRNLEDVPREEIWLDCDGTFEVIAPGREWRFALTVGIPN